MLLISKQYLHICDCCHKEHYISSSVYNRLLKGVQSKCCCSRECSNKLKMNSSIYCCDNCGKELLLTKYRISKSEKHFCSHKCKSEYIIKTNRVIKTCEFCSKEFSTTPSSTQRFCSVKCQNMWQKTQVGILNSHYKNTTYICDTCSKVFHIRPYKLNDNQHHFCSIECRQKWYSNYWCLQDEWKEFSRNNILKTFKSGKMSCVNTKPQLIANEILQSNNISFEREYSAHRYSIDIYLPSESLMIEINGDYWHSNPIRFNTPSEKQLVIINRDAVKNKFIQDTYGVKILYLWEKDLVRRRSLCEKLIKLYIDNNGALENYNSFNYHEDENGEISINDNIILSYQEQILLS